MDRDEDNEALKQFLSRDYRQTLNIPHNTDCEIKLIKCELSHADGSIFTWSVEYNSVQYKFLVGDNQTQVANEFQQAWLSGRKKLILRTVPNGSSRKWKAKQIAPTEIKDNTAIESKSENVAEDKSDSLRIWDLPRGEYKVMDIEGDVCKNNRNYEIKFARGPQEYVIDGRALDMQTHLQFALNHTHLQAALERDLRVSLTFIERSGIREVRVIYPQKKQKWNNDE